MKNILLIALLLTISLSVNAQIYKWVDDNGNIQYSQTPPMDRDAQVLRGDRTSGTPLTTERAYEMLLAYAAQVGIDGAALHHLL